MHTHLDRETREKETERQIAYYTNTGARQKRRDYGETRKELSNLRLRHTPHKKKDREKQVAAPLCYSLCSTRRTEVVRGSCQAIYECNTLQDPPAGCTSARIRQRVRRSTQPLTKRGTASVHRRQAARILFPAIESPSMSLCETWGLEGNRTQGVSAPSSVRRDQSLRSSASCPVAESVSSHGREPKRRS